MIQRYINGDSSVLEQNVPMYIDLSDYPTNYAEYLQAAINAERGFNELPVDVKRKYDNNWKLWLKCAGTKEWFTDLGISVDPDTRSDANGTEGDENK